MAYIEKLKSGSYRFQAYDGGGKRQYLTWKPPEGITPAKLEKELTRRAALFEEQVKHGQVADCTMKFSEFYAFWRDNYAVTHLAPKTVYTYGLLSRRILEQVGHIRVDRLNPARIQALLKYLSTEAVNENAKRAKKKDGEAPAALAGLSPKTVQEHFRLLSSVLSYAVELQYIPQNPCERVRPPKQTAKEAYSLSPEQVARLVTALDDEPLQFKTMMLLYLNVGLRKSELFGLQWKDFNTETGVLNVQRQVQYLPESGLMAKSLKTDNSARPVKLPASMVALLNAWYDEQAAMLYSLGKEWQADTPAHLRGDWIFISPKTFGPMHPDGFPKVLKHFLARVGFSTDEVKSIHLHTLRHTNASILIAANTNITAVAKRLGHAQTSTTMDIYSHFVRQADEVAAEAIDIAIHAATRRA